MPHTQQISINIHYLSTYIKYIAYLIMNSGIISWWLEIYLILTFSNKLSLKSFSCLCSFCDFPDTSRHKCNDDPVGQYLDLLHTCQRGCFDSLNNFLKFSVKMASHKCCHFKFSTLTLLVILHILFSSEIHIICIHLHDYIKKARDQKSLRKHLVTNPEQGGNNNGRD